MFAYICKVKIGLFFGSFNPIHIGHTIIANYFVQHTALQQIWFVVSPHNPFKEKKSLLNEYHRLEMVRLAIGDNLQLLPCDIEFKMPQPSYTVDTLHVLKNKYPNDEFCLIMGSDNLKNLHKWKNIEFILQHHEIYVYKRLGENENPYPDAKNIFLHDAPIIQISSTYIREQIKQKKSIQYLVDNDVKEAIEKAAYYQ